MDTKQTFSLSYDGLTGECVKMIKELQTNADSLDGIGFALEQAKNTGSAGTREAGSNFSCNINLSS
ncbi:hypothetical protein [Enterobacter sp. 148H3]|uniref:hypothetical protein n=1 Tax=Enterobacter sp. 148H3 TaxID=3077756 RepID=UPI0011BD8C33|nr:hypothetical protein [Enterobacter sp. 148H3]